jgi:RNA polymerase sigma-70 factor (ECF subfamily)
LSILAARTQVDAPPTVEAIYRAHGATVARWVLRLGGGRVDLEDAVQEVFAVVTARLQDFRGDSKLTTWLYGITENVVHRERRRARVRRWLSLSWRRAPGATPTLPPAALERKEAEAEVYSALDKLRDPYRAALILFEIEGLSGDEIAELKQVRVSTVWVWLHRARKQFLQALSRGEP